MEITPELLLKGKPTIIKGKEYLPTADYVQPFFDEMAKFTDKFIVKVQTPSQMTVTDGDEDVTYNRVWVQAVMPEKYDVIENHKTSVSMLYALDTKKPVIKLFKNTINMACLNMCVFSPDFINVASLEPESKLDFSFVKQIMTKIDKSASILKEMQNKFLSDDLVLKALGSGIDQCLKYEYSNGIQKVKLSETTPIKAYSSVYLDSQSKYFVKDQESTYFNIYNAFTDFICNDKDKDIVNKYEKVLLISKILGF